MGDFFQKLQNDLPSAIKHTRVHEANFPMYVALLRKLFRWMFALDHFNYARWLSVHLYDLLSLSRHSPQLHQSFMNGHFVFKKTENSFSLIGLDQVHEQNNAVLKGMGGVSSILTREDQSAVAMGALCARACINHSRL